MTELDYTCQSMPRVGDEGQRYVVCLGTRAAVFLENKITPLAFTDEHSRAVELAQAWVLRPSRPEVWIIDRRPDA